MGHEVTGSDIKASQSFERLRARGIAVVIGHQAENVAGADVLTYSTAVPERNVETRQQARRLDIPVLQRSRDVAGDRGPAPHDRRRGHARQDDDVVDARPRSRRGRVCTRASSSAAR